MVKKHTLILDNEFIQYCQLNKIENVDELAKQTFNKGFSFLKYGETPKSILKVEEKIIEKEVIKEVPVEKIVEIIKEVEVIKEVIKEVEIIKEVKGKTKTIINEVIKEVPIEKIIHVENTVEIDRLKKENEDLKSELNKITQALESFNRNKVVKINNTNDLYDE